MSRYASSRRLERSQPAIWRRGSRTPTPPSQPFRGSSAKSGPNTTSCVGPWTTSSGIATSGAGGPSGLQKGRGGGASQAEIRRRRPPGGHASQVAWEFQASSCAKPLDAAPPNDGLSARSGLGSDAFGRKKQKIGKQ